MQDEPKPSSGKPGQPERRRPAPTIDLKATEIASDPPPDAAAEPEQPPAPERPKPPPQDGANPDASRAERPRLAFPFWLPIGAGIAGAALTLAVAGLVMLATRDSDPGAVEQRIASLERRTADLSSRPAAPNPDLAARLQKLEAQVGALSTSPAVSAGDPALASRLAGIEAELHSLHDMAEALSGRTEDLAAGVADVRKRADANAAALAELAQKPAPSAKPDESPDVMAAMLAELADRVGALESRTPAAADRAARTAAAAGALAAAVERGAPFAAELKAAQAQASDPKLLAPLEPFAAAGLPSPSVLARELAALEPQLLAAEPAPAGQGGYLEKLKANASRLIQFGDQAPSGDEPSAVVVRAEFKVSHGEVSEALADLAKLPAPAREKVKPWIEKAEARMAALAASRKFTADSLAALGRP
jgi:hypothetical protein